MSDTAAPQQQQVVGPQPSPFTLVTNTVPTPQGNVVVIQLSTVVGPIMVFTDSKTAIAMGQQLIREGRQAATGLILPQQHRMAAGSHGEVAVDDGEDAEPLATIDPPSESKAPVLQLVTDEGGEEA